jgi:hypothetical protein
VIRHVPIEPVDALARHEFFDVEDAGALELHPLEVFLLEQVIVLGDSKAFPQVTARDILAGASVGPSSSLCGCGGRRW